VRVTGSTVPAREESLMGACEFEQIGLGRDVSEAFCRAVDDAQYEYGHGGYSGTLAEKHGCVLFSVPKGWKAADYAAAAQMYDRREYLDRRLTAADLSWCRTDEERAQRRARHNKDRALLRKGIASGEDTLRRVASQAYGDKWGSAAALELTAAETKRVKEQRGRKGTRDRAFLFFGMASS
jgi:hypothetical protein